MAPSEFWQRLSASIVSVRRGEGGTSGDVPRGGQSAARFWMIVDVLTVVVASAFATLHRFGTGPERTAREFWRDKLIPGRSMDILLAFLCGFVLVLIVTSRRLNLYEPTRLNGFLHEQRLNAQAFLTSGLLLTGALYLLHAEDIPRTIVLLTVALAGGLAGCRRLLCRTLLYRRFARGIGTRNVLIVGRGPEAHALRNHLDSLQHLGYTFKGFIDFHGAKSCSTVSAGEVVGTLDTLFQDARKHFVDEIFFTATCERGIISNVAEQARIHGVDLRVVPDLYDGLAWNSPIEYIGQFPTIPLHYRRVPELGLLFKRAFDIVFSLTSLVFLSPLLAAIAVAIKMDSPGPVFYTSERIGKKRQVFRCIKFRTMVRDAETRLSEIMQMNERDSVLFKISNDPRITRLGRLLRKYSLDELPQFINVLRGDMSVVGPRPPIASEVKEYKLSHLRRLDVTPGVTGLWQVQGRQDPSFASYVSLDVSYIDNWSVWLDFKIILRTIAVVVAGTGS